MLYTCIVNQNYLSKSTTIDKNITQEEIKYTLSIENGDEETKTNNSTKEVNMIKQVIEYMVNVEDTIGFESTSTNPQKALWYFRFFKDDKYEIRAESSKSILTVKNVSIEDQGLYKCINLTENNDEKYFKLSIESKNKPKEEGVVTLTLISKIIFYISLVTFLTVIWVGLWYIVRYRRNRNVRPAATQIRSNRNDDRQPTESIEMMNRDDASLYETPISRDEHLQVEVIQRPVRIARRVDINYVDKYGNIYSRPRPDNDYEEIL